LVHVVIERSLLWGRMDVGAGCWSMWKRGVRHVLSVEGSLLLCSELVAASTVLYHGLEGLLDNAVVIPGRALPIGDALVVENLCAYHAFNTFRQIFQDG